MNLSDFNYILPQSSIALSPVSPRDTSRLLLLDRNDGSVRDKTFHQVVNLLRKGDILVVNDTRVIPARLTGKKRVTGAAIDLLLLNRVKEKEGNVWEVLVKPARRVREGTEIIFEKGLLRAEVIGKSNGKTLVEFKHSGDFDVILEEIGKVPLPPYIKREEKKEDRGWYQTVYSRKKGAVAAPTAGFHFTEKLIKDIANKGVEIISLTLHVGWGTFRPVRENDITKHKMGSEFYELSEESAVKINRARENRGRVIAVGTTTTRALETLGDSSGRVKAGSGYTDKFIYPGYEFRIIDALITNFHLPKSTLLMLVSAFAGREKVLKAYEHALKHQYRFYSYGDAMFIT